MKREFQIRSTDLSDDSEEVICFDNLAEANEHYQKILTDQPGFQMEIELIEVLQQDTVGYVNY